MTNEDKIFNYIKSESPKKLSNSDISKATNIKPHQQVFQITNHLLNKGVIQGKKEGYEWIFWYPANSETIIKDALTTDKKNLRIHRNSLQPGHKIHWYEIKKVLGQGGFGITYLAYDPNLEKNVAIKEYLPIELAVRERDYSVHPVSEERSEQYKWGLDRFIAEARTLSKFDHPNIVRVLSVTEENNTAYMIMAYEHGQSLQQKLEGKKTLEEAELLKILIPILGGLELVHKAGFIHRDIKPDNIFIRQDGSPVLLDFGSARKALGVRTKTLTSLVSPGYAPFEQYYSKSDQ